MVHQALHKLSLLPLLLAMHTKASADGYVCGWLKCLRWHKNLLAKKTQPVCTEKHAACRKSKQRCNCMKQKKRKELPSATSSRNCNTSQVTAHTGEHTHTQHWEQSLENKTAKGPCNAPEKTCRAAPTASSWCGDIVRFVCGTWQSCAALCSLVKDQCTIWYSPKITINVK